MTEREIHAEDVKKVASLPYDWDKLQKKTLLVSGGTGFLGGFLLDVLRERNKAYGNQIKILSLSRRKQAEDGGEVRYLAADVAKPFTVEEKVDYVLHLASNTHPEQYEKDPVGTIASNVFGAKNLLDIAKNGQGVRFLLASSVEIYGEGKGTPMRESYGGYIDCNTYRAGYNESKRVCESLCQSYRKQYGTDVVVARLARCFGDDRTKTDTKAFAQFIRSATDGTGVVLKSAGMQRFSYCYVADAVSGLIKILLDGVSGEAYNVSEEDEGATLRDYAEKIAKLADSSFRSEVQAVAGASTASYAVLDVSKLRSLGWSPLYTVSEGIARTVQSMKAENFSVSGTD